MFYRNSCINADSVDPDQMLHSLMSDLGLHCLPITLLGVSGLKWVKLPIIIHSKCYFAICLPKYTMGELSYLP